MYLGAMYYFQTSMYPYMNRNGKMYPKSNGFELNKVRNMKYKLMPKLKT